MAALPIPRRALALWILCLAAPGSAATRPVVSPILLPTASPAPAGSGGSLVDVLGDAATASLFEPRLAVYGQRAALRWLAAGDALLSVDFGETPALGRHADESARPVFGGTPLRGGDPAPRVHRVSLDGLQTGRSYYYRGTLSKQGAVIADTGVLPFETPLAFVRVRPVEIAMAKDGDHDVEVSVGGEELYDSANEGEVYIEWTARVKAAPGDFAYGRKAKGCYPGGAAIDLLFPDAGQPDAGGQDSPDDPADDTTFDPTTGAQTPTLHGDPQAWAPVDGCVAYRYDAPVRVDEAKIGSGEEVELGADRFPAMEWELPADLPGEPIGVVGNALAPDEDGDGEPDSGPSQPYEPPAPEPPCGDVAPGTFALVRLATRGQEFDYVPSPQGMTRIINHDASDADVLCLDLRGEEQTIRKGVRAEAGSLEFTTWFEVTLDYRLVGEEPPADGELEALGTPVVVEPSRPAALAASPAEPDAAAPEPEPDGRPTVDLRAKPRLREGKRRGSRIKVTRSGDTSFPMFVGYTVGGTAANGVDYAPLLGSLEIPAGKRSAKLVVTPIDDAEVEGAETLEIELLPDYGYAPGPSSRVSIELLSDDR
jgi:hypothetical protein